jgi:hypothetical protein
MPGDVLLIPEDIPLVLPIPDIPEDVLSEELVAVLIDPIPDILLAV